MSSFAEGFRMGSDAWRSAADIKSRRERDERERAEHDARMREVQRLEDYRSAIQNAPGADFNAPAQQVGLRPGDEQWRMLAQQAEGFGDEGRRATLDAAAPAVGLQQAPEARAYTPLEMNRQYQSVANRFGRTQDAAAYGQQVAQEFAIQSRQLSGEAAQLAMMASNLPDNPSSEQLAPIFKGMQDIMRRSQIANVALLADPSGKKVTPIGDADGSGVMRPLGDTVGMDKKGVMSMLEDVRNVVSNPEVFFEARRKRQMDELGLGKAEREERIGAATEKDAIAAAGLANEKTRAGTRKEDAAAGYYRAQAGAVSRNTGADAGAINPEALKKWYAWAVENPDAKVEQQVAVLRLLGIPPEAFIPGLSEEGAKNMGPRGGGDSGTGKGVPKPVAPLRDSAAERAERDAAMPALQAQSRARAWLSIAQAIDVSRLAPAQAESYLRNFKEVMPPEHRAALESVARRGLRAK